MKGLVNWVRCLRIMVQRLILLHKRLDLQILMQAKRLYNILLNRSVIKEVMIV